MRISPDTDTSPGLASAALHRCVLWQLCDYAKEPPLASLTYSSAPARRVLSPTVPSLFLASSFKMYLNCEVLTGMFPWRTRYPLG